MPLYEYFCSDCQETFSKVLTLHEHDNENPRCPRCGSEKVDQRYSAFFAVTSRKSA
jgi:putative FmdB family regulatory protein